MKKLVTAFAILAFTLGAFPAPLKAFQRDDWRTFIVCDFSHSARNDPIVHPGMKNMAHLHDFFGNEGTNWRTSFKYMAGNKSSCELRFDRSAYWTPAIRNIATGAVRHATHIQVYIQNKGKVGGMVPWPKSFKVITTDYLMLPATRPLKWNGAGIRYLFDDQCWNGTTTDGRYDGTGYLVEADNGRCPSDHPILLPHLHFNVRYGIPSLDGWEPVSSPEMGWHADFWNTWDQNVLKDIVKACLNPPALDAEGRGCGRLKNANLDEVLAARG